MTCPDDAPRLPPLHDVLLDDATVDQLFFDLSAVAQVVGVTVKGGATSRAGDEAPGGDLGRARELLARGQAHGVQIRYVHDGREWWDTLLRVPGGTRLVRVCRDHVT